MKNEIGKRTARLVCEAMILGFVEGVWCDTGLGKEDFSSDSEIISRVLRAAKSHKDIYPLLSKIEDETL